MAQFIEFLSNHPILVGCWLAAFIGIMVYHQRTGSKGASPAQAITLINRSDALVVDIRIKKISTKGILSMPCIFLRLSSNSALQN